MAPAKDFDDMAVTFGKMKEFMEVDFSLRTAENVAQSPPKKAALNTRMNYYQSLINKPGQVVQRLYPVITQCEAINADTLKASKLHLIRQ